MSPWKHHNRIQNVPRLVAVCLALLLALWAGTYPCLRHSAAPSGTWVIGSGSPADTGMLPVITAGHLPGRPFLLPPLRPEVSAPGGWQPPPPILIIRFLSTDRDGATPVRPEGIRAHSLRGPPLSLL